MNSRLHYIQNRQELGTDCELVCCRSGKAVRCFYEHIKTAFS
jgi:hypothetical protein